MIELSKHSCYKYHMKLTTYRYADRHRICHIEFPTHLSMVLGIGRPQEFAEHVDFEGKWLTMPEFFDKVCKAETDDDYIPVLYGVNLPGTSYLRWMERATLTLQEARVRRLLGNDLESTYIIGSIGGDPATLDHEIAHAIYSFNSDYVQDTENLIAKVPQTYMELTRNYLQERQYSERVYNDERQAFFSTSPDEEIIDHFHIDPIWRIPFIDRFQQEKQRLVKVE